MAHLIDKDALVAEIEKGIKEAYGNEWGWAVKCEAYDEILSFLDTLEVKEVDLKQSYIEYINNTYNEEFAKSILDDNIKSDLDNSDLFGIMSYGFELGIKSAQKGE